MADVFRPPKQWLLTENESVTSFTSWKSNMLYHLSLNNEFSQFLDGQWAKHNVPNRGLLDSGTDTTLVTAIQKKIRLERMLGLISQFCPSLLRSEIIKKSTSLSWIWQRLRKHYSFSQSEVNFLKLYSIKRKDDERYETFFQRIIAHLEDNLLTKDSGILHDGAKIETNEEMTPTVERLATYLWLNLIDSRLPGYISRIYAHDLQTRSIKDLQPQLAECMDALLMEINVQEDVQISYTSSFLGIKIIKRYL